MSGLPATTDNGGYQLNVAPDRAHESPRGRSQRGHCNKKAVTIPAAHYRELMPEVPMSINDYVDDLEASARYALGTAKAIEVCPFHSDATIRRFDDDAERHAYALATKIIKSDGTMWMREDLMTEIKRQLDEADDECHQCANTRDS
jgi:hypothetical protein